MWRSLRGSFYHGCDGKIVACCRQQQSIQRRLQKSFRHLYSTLPSSSSSSSASGGRIIFGIAGTAVVIGGGTIVAAKLNPGFRSFMEEKVPYSSQVLTLILGEVDVPPRLDVKSKQAQEFPFRSSRQPNESAIINKKSAPITPAPVIDTPFIESRNKDDASKSEGLVSHDKLEKSKETSQVTADQTFDKTSLKSKDPAVDESSHLKTSSQKPDSLTVEESVNQFMGQNADVPLDKKLNSQIDLEIKRKEQEIDQIYKEKSGYFPKEYKEELLKHLRRQAVFHSEYLRALLQAQRKELKSEFEDVYQDKIAEAKRQLQLELASSLAELSGIKDELTAYVDTHNKWTAAKKLWVASWALKLSCNPTRQDGVSYEDQRKPLAEEVEFLSAAGSDDQFTKIIIQAIPEEALKSGVYSKEILIERFFKLDSMCRRVALIGESGGSLFKYASSYLQSLLIGSSNRFRASDAADEPVDISKSDIFNILDKARWYVLQGNLETAVRYVNLLKGTPRKVASDWLKDARLFLEVSQVADVLIARSGTTDALLI